MSYRLPVFNVTVNVWRFVTPVTDPPDLSPVVNFNVGKRVGQMLEGEVVPGIGPFGYSWVLAPIGTVIIGDTDSGGFGDTLEIPQGSGRYYHCMWSEISAMGFANMHVAALVVRLPNAPTPPDNILLLEDLTPLLLEDLDTILLEP